MAFRFRYIVIILSVLAVLGVGAVVLFFWYMSSAFRYLGSGYEAPEELKQARVLRGKEFLSRQEFFKLKTRGMLSAVWESATETDEIKQQQKLQSEIAKQVTGFESCAFDAGKNEVIFVGMFGAEVLDLNGDLKREILWEPAVNKVKVGWIETESVDQGFQDFKTIDLDNDGNYEFMAYGHMGTLAVYDGQGNGLWRYGKPQLDLGNVFDQEKFEKEAKKHPSIRSAAAGDLDGDGTAEIVFTTANDEMIALDSKGQEKWRKADEYPGNRLWIFDLDGDKKAEILEFSYSSSKLFDHEGNLTKKLVNSAESFFIRDDGKKKELNFLEFYENKLTVADENGKKLMELDAPMGEVKNDKARSVSTPIVKEDKTDTGTDGKLVEMPVADYDEDAVRVHSAEAVQVKLKSNEEKYLAILADYILLDRSVLYIYSSDGKLVYNELLPESGKVIMAVPDTGNNREQLFVGGKQTIWRYDAR